MAESNYSNIPLDSRRAILYMHIYGDLPGVIRNDRRFLRGWDVRAAHPDIAPKRAVISEFAVDLRTRVSY